jgi:hypothetical protein
VRHITPSLAHVCACVSQLDCPRTQVLLSDTASYYKRKAAEWINEDSCPEYMLKVGVHVQGMAVQGLRAAGCALCGCAVAAFLRLWSCARHVCSLLPQHARARVPTHSDERGDTNAPIYTYTHTHIHTRLCVAPPRRRASLQAEECLGLEEERVYNYLHTSTKSKLLRQVCVCVWCVCGVPARKLKVQAAAAGVCGVCVVCVSLFVGARRDAACRRVLRRQLQRCACRAHPHTHVTPSHASHAVTTTTTG